MYKNHGSKGLEEGDWGLEGVESMLLARSDEMNRKERKTQRGITKDAGSVALNLPSLDSPPRPSPIFPGALLVISLSLSSSLHLYFPSSPSLPSSSNYIMWKALEMLANSVPVLPRINSKAIVDPFY